MIQKAITHLKTYSRVAELTLKPRLASPQVYSFHNTILPRKFMTTLTQTLFLFLGHKNTGLDHHSIQKLNLYHFYHFSNVCSVQEVEMCSESKLKKSSFRLWSRWQSTEILASSHSHIKITMKLQNSHHWKSPQV